MGKFKVEYFPQGIWEYGDRFFRRLENRLQQIEAEGYEVVAMDNGRIISRLATPAPSEGKSDE